MRTKEFYLKRWPIVRADLDTLLDSFEEAELTFVPVEGGWNVGRLMLHISSAANYWLHSGILSSHNYYQPGESCLENYPTLAAIRGFMREEHQRTIRLLETFNRDNWEMYYDYPDGFTYQPSWIFWHVLEHEIHHRGELSLILGLLGREGLDV